MLHYALLVMEHKKQPKGAPENSIRQYDSMDNNKELVLVFSHFQLSEDCS